MSEDGFYRLDTEFGESEETHAEHQAQGRAGFDAVFNVLFKTGLSSAAMEALDASIQTMAMPKNPLSLTRYMLARLKKAHTERSTGPRRLKTRETKRFFCGLTWHGLSISKTRS